MFSPVRKIGVNCRSITGTMPNGNRYESSLERDLMILLDFDPTVHLFTPQPLKIPYQTSDGVWHSYTPDGLIEYRNDLKLPYSKPILLEVKYRDDFKNSFATVISKYRAANNLAKANGWVFKIYTEDQIRGSLLENVKFLRGYLNCFDTGLDLLIQEKMKELKFSCPSELISSIFIDKWNQARLIPILWGLIARREIGCDLATPLMMSSKIWSL